jgi:iron complex transport system substrate-binding protein
MLVLKEARVTQFKMVYRRISRQAMRRFPRILLSTALVLALALMACEPRIPSGSREFVDDLGRTVTIEGVPERIISLSPSNTEILFALNLADSVVGVTDWCNYPAEALEKEKVGGYDTPDIEKIVALNPDLILAAHGLPLEIIGTLEDLGLIVFGIKSTDLDDLLDDIRTVGEITNRETEADALTSEMAARIQAVVAQTAELEETPKVFYIVWHDPLFTVGTETFIHELIEKAGGVNIFGDLTGYPIVSIEEVLARDPEVIVTSMWSYEWATNATELVGTNASQMGRIHTVDDDLVQRPAPRIVQGLEWFAHFIHPTLFDEPDGG